MKLKDKPLWYAIGRRILDLRASQKPKMTQEYLGQRVGLTRASIANIEAGNQTALLPTLYDIANELNCEITELIPMEDPR